MGILKGSTILISLYFLEGSIVLQANITTKQNKVTFCSKIKEKYICSGTVKLTPEFEEGEIISMVFLVKETIFEIYYAGKVIYQYEHKMPVWAVQYVVVTGPLSNIEGRKIAEIHTLY
ncbi:hypothetical protein ACQ4LE_000913 [Meloidogyne hapla]